MCGWTNCVELWRTAHPKKPSQRCSTCWAPLLRWEKWYRRFWVLYALCYAIYVAEEIFFLILVRYR